MSNKLNLPDEIWLGRKDYSFWTDWHVNGWLFVATISSGLSDILFAPQVREWPVTLRTVIAVLPFIALVLWVRSLAKWIRGMDELHRRITVAATLLSIGATFFVVMLWHRLERAGLFQSIFPSSSMTEGAWDIGTVGHSFLLMTFFYFAGYRFFNRRYQ